MVAVMVAVANLALCGAVVAVLGAARGGTAPAASTTSASPRPGGPPAEEAATSAYEQVTGPGGMTTRIPAGWPTKRATGPGSWQADDPAGTSTMLRYGGAATPVADSYDRHADYARDFAARRANYVPIRLDRTLVRGNAAIDWEFEYDDAGGRRHVRAVYWLHGGHEYFVYASAPVPLWPETRKVLEVMLTYSTP